jgi:hypothetical protein
MAMDFPKSEKIFPWRKDATRPTQRRGSRMARSIARF